MAEATDGSWIVGRVGRSGGQRAALWREDGSPPAVLGDGRSASEAYGVRDGEQVGVRWTSRGTQAALCRGSAASFVDLTPRGHASAVAMDCAGGLQVGHACEKDTTGNGSGSMAHRAALWAGSASSHFDLQAVAPDPWNASCA